VDEKTADDKVKELRLQVYALRDRVNRLEVAVFRTVVAVGAAAMVLGYFLPFLTATEKADDGEDDSIGLLPAVFGLGDSGDGPFSEEATLAAIVVGVFALAILVALIALLRLFGNEVGSGAVRFARVCGIVLLVVCACGWLLVFALAGHFEGRVSAFSPATLSFTIGGAATIVAAALHPAEWRA
jgi:hypothetical protein